MSMPGSRPAIWAATIRAEPLGERTADVALAGVVVEVGIARAAGVSSSRPRGPVLLVPCRRAILVEQAQAQRGGASGRDRRDRIGRGGSAERLLEDREGYARCRTESRGGDGCGRRRGRLGRVQGAAEAAAGRRRRAGRTKPVVRPRAAAQRRAIGLSRATTTASARRVTSRTFGRSSRSLIAIDRRPGEARSGRCRGRGRRSGQRRSSRSRARASSRGGPGRCCSRDWRSASGRGSAAPGA